ncbi:hypothetical protein A2U01_0038668, partial [Trifolium medium]|nr:hypothetical protein [Trifolium medium]
MRAKETRIGDEEDDDIGVMVWWVLERFQFEMMKK